MNIRVFYTFLVILTVSLSSCFELLEIVTLSEDGSGSAKIVLNMSRSRTQLNEVTKKDSIGSIKIPSQENVLKALSHATDTLSTITGISNAKYNANFEDYIFTMTVDFDSPEKLNTAYNILLSGNKHLRDLFIYAYNSNFYSRTINSNAINKLKQHKTLLSLYGIDKGRFTTIVKTKTEITNISNPKTRLATSHKSVLNQVTIEELINTNKLNQLKLNFE